MLYKCIKRGFDVISSSLALIALSPILLIICIGIKVSSKGPILYKSERVGLNGKHFIMLKFRSMHMIVEGTVESKYVVNSSRVFKFGNFLRKSKLDELPQLVNVLLSDMSIVGPRPYPQSIVDSVYFGNGAIVLTVKPGLSCYDSLYDYAHGELFETDEEKYANEIIPVRTELAKLYVSKKSIKTDAIILFRTIKMIWDIIILRKSKFKYNSMEQIAINTIRKARE